jgi:hypothetical protein
VTEADCWRFPGVGKKNGSGSIPSHSESSKKIGCGGLQPSELFSLALQFGTDSRRSVTYMKVLSSPVASGLLTMPKLGDENTARAGFTGTPLLDSFRVADDTAGMCLGAATYSEVFAPPSLRKRRVSPIQRLIDSAKVAFWLLGEVLMEISALAQSASERYPKLASPIHTIFVLAVMGGWTVGHKMFADQLGAAANPHRVGFYVVTLIYEWLLFVLVVAGVRRSGASVLIVLGEHWHSVRQVLRDIGIAAGFWIVAAPLDIWLAPAHHCAGS